MPAIPPANFSSASSTRASRSGKNIWRSSRTIALPKYEKANRSNVARIGKAKQQPKNCVSSEPFDNSKECFVKHGANELRPSFDSAERRVDDENQTCPGGDGDEFTKHATFILNLCSVSDIDRRIANERTARRRPFWIPAGTAIGRDEASGRRSCNGMP